MRNIKITFSFDGSDFHGYQIQPNAHTIESEITNALMKITKEDIKLIGCGRTDAGVHALKYIANFKTNSKITCDKLPIALNSNISDTISISLAEDVSEDFHSRYCVLKKTYVYRIHNSKIRQPFIDKYVYKYGGELDFELMKQASKEFIGTHDFSSHKSLGTETKTSVRTMFDCNIEKIGDIIEITMTADGFLYNMARTIAGTILFCGQKKINPNDIAFILENKDRKLSGPTLQAKGLFMKDIEY